jgi:uncharacterized membrane protein HdeD (DUF308 family)
MIDSDPFPLKKVSLWFLFICFCVLSAFFVFIALVSVWVGLTHTDRDGFWVPILAGVFVVAFISWLFFRLTKFIYGRIKDRDLINV